MKKQLLLWACCMLAMHPFSVNGQSPDKKMLPNGRGGLNSSLGNMVSPSLFDGSANVNIPIYDYGSFGISLSYNTKGVTLDELSGPVGTHWNLNGAGGTITRNLKDLPDEANEFIFGTTYKLVGRTTQYGLAAPKAQEYWDQQNDEFVVSAGDLQFSFMLGKNGYVLSYPQNRCKITPIAVGDRPFFKFLITDEQGNSYYFERGEDMAVGSFSFGNEGAKTFAYTPKWFLDKVVFSNGQTIVYEYEVMDIPSDELSGAIGLYKTSTRYQKSNGGDVLSEWGIVWLNDQLDWTYIIKTIQYPDNVKATFVYDQPEPPDGGRYMKSIKQIEISQGNNCQKYRFIKSNLTRTEQIPYKEGPFISNGYVDAFNKRTMLKNIVKLNCDESITEPYYTFEYSATAVPFRWGNNRDFFGYCNGIITNVGDDFLNAFLNQVTTHRHPFITNNVIPASNRANTTNADIMAALCLKKVINAYGGSLSFQYEIHSGLVSVTDAIAGMPNPATDYLFLGKDANDGLRLRSTITEDKYRPASKLVTTYEYSGGQRFLNGGYFSYPSIMNQNKAVTEYASTNSWISPHQLVNGSNHGYSQVTVTTSDAGGNMLSKEKHYFSNFQEGGVLHYLPAGTTSSRHYFQMPYTDKQYIKNWRLGLPSSTETFDAYGNITSRTSNTYAFSEDYTSALTGLGKNVNVMRVKMVSTTNAVTNVNIFNNACNIATDTFVPFTGKALLKATTTQKFVNNSIAITDGVEYSYDSRNNLQTTITTNSRNERNRMENIYNYSVSSPAGTTLAAMTNAGLEILVSMERWSIKTPTPAADLLLDASLTGYRYQSGKMWTQKLHTLRSLQPVAYSSYTNAGSTPYNRLLTAYNTPGQAIPDFQPASEVLQFDAKGNPTETQLAGQNSYVSMIWDNNGHKLAEASCRLADMGYTGFEDDNHGNWIYSQLNVGSTGISGPAVDGRVYKTNTASDNLRQVSLTPGKSYKIAFWCRGGFPYVTCGGGVPLENVYNVTGWNYYQARFVAGSSTLTLTPGGSLNSTAYLDNVRICAEDAQMTSTSYLPLWGIRSTADVSGRITYYEYDSFGRLVVTRDQEGKVVAKKEYHTGQ